MNIKNAKHVHFTGIKGVGMTSLALCCQDLGIKITGSDVEEEFVTDETLKNRGVVWKIGFKKEHLDPKPDLLVFTGAHGGLNNPEVLAAKEIDIPVISHAEALGQIAEGKKTIAVCGVGGKTTTCAMIATILEYAGLNPSYAIGVGNIPSTGAPGKYSKEGEYFICEADEFAISPGIDNRPRFSLLKPNYLSLTNITHDHPDIYPTFDDFKKVFAKFIMDMDYNSFIIGNADTYEKLPIPPDFLDSPEWHWYSKDKDYATWQLTALGNNKGKTTFNLLHKEPNIGFTELYKLTLKVPGMFNIYNATAAFVICLKIGVDSQVIIEGLKKYTGCKRRFEKVGEHNGILFYDDYAHHPTEIYQTLLAMSQWYNNRRIVVLFQPHTYSRTKALLNEFSKSFIHAEVVAITDIFASAREPDDPTINSKILIEEIKKNVGVSEPENAIYVGDLTNAAKWALKTLKPGDIFITLGAGDIYKIHKLILERI